MSLLSIRLNNTKTPPPLDRAGSFRKSPTRLFAILTLLILTAFTISASAQTDFENPAFTTGTVHGQNGWQSLGTAGLGCGSIYDHLITTNNGSAPVSFGAQSLRISNSVTGGCFHDNTFSASNANEAGESVAIGSGFSGGTRQNMFEYQFSIASAVPGAHQPGMVMSVAPDRGDGSRMSYLRFEDQADGIHVIFDDFIDAAPFGGAVGDPVGCGNEDDFTDIDIATLSRTAPHTIKFVMFFLDGPRNDVVQIYIDGALVKTGTSWEDYFRYCEGTQTRTVDSMLFRTGGTAVPANAGKGFLFDGASSSSSTNATPTLVVDADGLASDTDCNANTPAHSTINSAVAAANPGDTVRVCSGVYTLSSTVNVNKANLTLLGVGGTRPVIQMAQAIGHGFNVSANGIVLDNFDIQKTDAGSPSGQALVYVGGNNFEARNNLMRGLVVQDWSTSGNVSRAFVVAAGNTGLNIHDNTIHTLRQPMYTSGVSGTITNNTVYGTRGWVVESGAYVFSGNNFSGTPQNVGADIALLATVNPANYPDLVALSLANDNAYISAQFAGGVSGRANSNVNTAAASGGNGQNGFAYRTVNAGVNGALVGGTVNVAAGTYNEDVVVNRDVTVTGAGIDVSIIKGPKTGNVDTVLLGTSGVTFQGFTITRDGNNTTDWNTTVKNQGVNIAQGSTGIVLQNNKITGNRNGVYMNNSGNTIRRNIIDFNRTGIQTANNITGAVIEENFITDNWTVGLLFNFDTPSLMTTSVTVRNNNISGNWYGEVVNRAANSPAILNLSGNWLGTTNVTTTTANSSEPPYASQIPVEYGGSAVAPGGQLIIGGPESGKIDYSPWLNSGSDTDLATPGFQGDFSNLSINATSPQATAGLSNIQEAIDLMTAGGTLIVPNGTYAGNVNVNKAITIKGTFTVGGTFTTSVAGVNVNPGYSPGIISTGNLSFSAGTNVNMEINGTTPGTGHDQFDVTGTVSLGNANLIVSTGFTPVAGNTFTIINNDGGDAVTGTFNAMPEGTVFYVGANSFRISYIGGTGNDVVLTAVSLCNTVSIPTNLTSTVATPANTINVPVNVDDVTGHGLYSFDFTLNYNPAVINNPVVTTTAMTSITYLTVNSSTPGVLVVSGFQLSNTSPIPPLSGSGALVNINFTVVGGIGSSSGINFSSFMFNEGTPCLSTSNGLVTIISGTISGQVTYLNNATLTPVPGAILSAAGAVNVSDTTDANGLYDLSNLGNSTYTVTPSKSGDLSPGGIPAISGQDATRIAQHVVNISPFTPGGGAFKSADVSGNGTITSFDASMVARFVVNLPDTGSTGTWRFEPVNRSYSLAQVQTGMTAQDYKAILMGDVTGNWSDTTPSPTRMNVREEDKIAVNAPTMSVDSGAEIIVPVELGNLNDNKITSYQFELTYNPKVLKAGANPCDVLTTISKDMSVVCNGETAGVLKVVVFGIKPLDKMNASEKTGVLLNLRFIAIGSAGDVSPLTFKQLLLNEGEPQSRTTDGEIRINPNTNDSDSISGRLLSAGGQAIAETEVRLTASNGETRTVYSNELGYFNFDKVVVGETYVITVNSKRHNFDPQAVSAAKGVTRLDIIAGQ